MNNRKVLFMKKICRLLVLCLLLSVCTAFAETSDEVSGLISQAQAALEAADYETAVPLLRTAADAGNDQAQLWLGNCYDTGAGVEQNAEEAVKYYLLAADRGNIPAVYNLAFCYLDGRGVEQDTAAGETWLYRAARLGNARAKMLLETR